jgi:methyl-accepting chemotaxis protein
MSDSLRKKTLTPPALMAELEHDFEQIRKLATTLSHLDLVDATEKSDRILAEIMNTVFNLSKKSMSMVYAMDDIIRSVVEAEKSLADVEHINKQTNLLALNAMIEAERAGEAGITFKVVADEVRSLSRNVNQLSEQIRTQVVAIADGVRQNRDVLQELAGTDVAHFVTDKDEICRIQKKIVEQNFSADRRLRELSTHMEDRIQHLRIVFAEQTENALSSSDASHVPPTPHQSKELEDHGTSSIH